MVHSRVPNDRLGMNIWPLPSAIGSMIAAANRFMPQAVLTGPISCSDGRER